MAKVYLIFRYRCGQDSTTHWILPFNKFWNGSARTGRRTARHRLHTLFRHGHEIRHGGILNTGKSLDSGECGNQKNGKTKSGGRNGKRRQQTIHVHTSIRKRIADEYCFNCFPSRLEFSFFFAVLHIHQPCSFLCLPDYASRHWQNVVNATEGVQKNLTVRTHAHVYRCVPHFAQFIQCTCVGSRCSSDAVCLSKIIPSAHHVTPSVFLSSLLSLLSCLRPRRLRHC